MSHRVIRRNFRLTEACLDIDTFLPSGWSRGGGQESALFCWCPPPPLWNSLRSLWGRGMWAAPVLSTPYKWSIFFLDLQTEERTSSPCWTYRLTLSFGELQLPPTADFISLFAIIAPNILTKINMHTSLGWSHNLKQFFFVSIERIFVLFFILVTCCNSDTIVRAVCFGKLLLFYVRLKS